LLLLTMLAGRSPVSAQSTEGTVRLQPPTTPDARVDDPFAVYIGLEDMQHEATVSGVASDGLGAFEFTLLFDPAVLEIHGAEAGSLLNSTGRSFQCFQRSDDPGSFSFACVSTGNEPGPQGTFTLAQVSIRPIEAGSSLLHLENVDLGGPLAVDDIPVNVFGASAVSVTGSPVPASTQPGPGATSGPAPTSGIAAAAQTPAPADGTASPDDGTASPSQTALVIARATEAQAKADQEEGGVSPTSVALAVNPGAETENEASSGGDGGSSGNVRLWSAAAVGGVVAAGALGLTLVLWRRNQRL
jgi:hypothetical protein